MKKNIAILMMVGISLLGSACTVEPDDLNRTLEDEGYYDIQDEGYALFGCADSDQYRSAFTAKRRMPNGSERVVTGTVCCGLMKNCTVRH